MWNGLQAAVQADYTDIQIEGDNKILIKAIQERIQPPWEIQILIQDILAYIQLCNKIFIHHIFGQDNHVADWVAKFDYSLHSTAV